MERTQFGFQAAQRSRDPRSGLPALRQANEFQCKGQGNVLEWVSTGESEGHRVKAEAQKAAP